MALSEQMMAILAPRMNSGDDGFGDCYAAVCDLMARILARGARDEDHLTDGIGMTACNIADAARCYYRSKTDKGTGGHA